MGTAADPQNGRYSSSENVCGFVTSKNQGLQDSLVGGVDDIRLLSLVRFRGERHQCAFHLSLGGFAGPELLEDHDVVVAVHGMQDLVFAAG